MGEQQHEKVVGPVVIVDDNPDDIFLLSRVVGRARLPTIAFDNPKDAIEYLLGAGAGLRDMPSAVLCDIRMPGMNGFEFLAKLRSTPEISKLACAMVSSSSLAEDKEKARALGADRYFVKFPAPEDITALVKASLRNV